MRHAGKVRWVHQPAGGVHEKASGVHEGGFRRQRLTGAEQHFGSRGARLPPSEPGLRPPTRREQRFLFQASWQRDSERPLSPPLLPAGAGVPATARAATLQNRRLWLSLTRTGNGIGLRASACATWSGTVASLRRGTSITNRLRYIDRCRTRRARQAPRHRASPEHDEDEMGRAQTAAKSCGQRG